MTTPGIPVVTDPGGLTGSVGTPGSVPPPLDGQATVERAWWLFMQRIGFHNPRLYQSGGRALDAMNNLRRGH